VWEIRYDSKDYPVRQIRLQQVLDDFFFDQEYRLLIGADRVKHSGQGVELDSGKRIPMRKPSGKYYVYNKINRSAGTSH
jgi:RecB family endonuclease NucS